jgi:myo-inositol 2-dehydrogenase/D-chiro-inositol 1-dehydrogenase
MGGLPESVTAVGSSIVDPEIGPAGGIDTAVVTLRFADGRIAVIKNSRRAVYGYDQRFELLGSEGLLSAGNVLENTVSKATKGGVTSAKPEFFFLERYMRAYSAGWAAFVDAVNLGSALPVTLDDGVNALAVAEAATRSAKSSQSVSLASI